MQENTEKLFKRYWCVCIGNKGLYPCTCIHCAWM